MLAKPEYFSPPDEVCCWPGRCGGAVASRGIAVELHREATASGSADAKGYREAAAGREAFPGREGTRHQREAAAGREAFPSREGARQHREETPSREEAKMSMGSEQRASAWQLGEECIKERAAVRRRVH